MPANLSNKLKAQLFKQFSDDPFVALYTLSHPNFASTFRLAANTEDIVSNGFTYVFYPIDVSLPVDDGETVRKVELRLSNVDLSLIRELRQITTPVDVTMQMVLASDPDTIEYELPALKLSNIRYNSQEIVGTLTLDDILSKRLTSEQYTPKNFPGIFV